MLYFPGTTHALFFGIAEIFKSGKVFSDEDSGRIVSQLLVGSAIGSSSQTRSI